MLWPAAALSSLLTIDALILSIILQDSLLTLTIDLLVIIDYCLISIVISK